MKGSTDVSKYYVREFLTVKHITFIVYNTSVTNPRSLQSMLEG